MEEDDSWRLKANCRGMGPGIFYDDEGINPGRGGWAEGERFNLARKICGDCVVQEPCLEFAVDTNERFGLWAGRDEHQIRIIRRKRMRGSRPRQKKPAVADDEFDQLIRLETLEKARQAGRPASDVVQQLRS